MKRIYSWLILLGFLELVGCRSIPAGYEENEVELSSVALLHDQVGKLKTEIALVQVAMEKEIASVNTIKNLVNAYESYKSNSGFQPMDNGFLEALIRKDETFAGLYLHPMKISTTDAWGNPLLIQSNKNGDYWIASGGSDGKFSGFEQEGFISWSLWKISPRILYFTCRSRIHSSAFPTTLSSKY